MVKEIFFSYNSRLKFPEVLPGKPGRCVMARKEGEGCGVVVNFLGIFREANFRLKKLKARSDPLPFKNSHRTKYAG